MRAHASAVCAEPGTRAERDQVRTDSDHALRKWATAMALVILGLAILAASWKWNSVDLPYYYSRLWHEIKPFFRHWFSLVVDGDV